ncbi:MAG: DNA polymerase, partial [Patescibacteria group bacterium]
MSPSKNHKSRLVLIDAHAIIHRAYHALPDFATSAGQPTGALYGLVTMLAKLITDLKPDHIAACYDLPAPTHRHEAYEAYKGTRKKIDDALIAQLESSKEIFAAFGIPMYSVAGFEADDVLATIVEKLSADSDAEIIIASGDMDTMQLVSGQKVRVFTLRKGISDTILYDEVAVKERFGFEPRLIPDYKGLSGDTSDNIIGVPGIGEKTATNLIQTFGTIEEIFVALKKNREKFIAKGVKERTATLLTEHEDEALFSKMLATVRRDAPVDFSLPDKKWNELIDLPRIEKLFKTLEFRTLLDRVKVLMRNSTTTPEVTPTKKPIEKSAETETETEKENVDPVELEKTALALWVVDSNISNPTLEDILNYGKADTFAEAQAAIFAKLKEGRTREVYEEIELPLVPVIREMEKHGVLIDTGYLKKLSREYHVTLNSLEKKIWKLAGEEFNINSPKQMSQILFEKMALGSGAVGKDGAAGAKVRGKKTAGGMRSTKESELEKVRGEHEIIGLILEYRELQKLLSTYIDSILERIGAVQTSATGNLFPQNDDRLHAHFLQTGTTTGRISSEEPNMQNIPIKTELGKKIRDAFIATPGFALAALDYSQIELRIAAFLSGDEKLLEVFKSGGDIHTAVASQVFGVAPEKVDKEMRRRAKVINFGIIYGMGVNALRKNLGGTREEAQKFYDNYFN